MTIAVQVNGKLRDTLTAPKGAPREALEAMALGIGEGACGSSTARRRGR